MKILSIAVPCYNSQDYMANCIESLLKGGDDVEILVVNDGSADKTKEIADEYQAKYPGIVKAIHKPNGGHGSAVNAGLENATGLYFKVVDSDDWVDLEAYETILARLKTLTDDENQLDLLLSNYVYEKVGVKKKTVIRYTGIIPEEKVVGWDDIGKFKLGHYILMHAAIYRTKLLRDCGLKLPEHTFYVDNLYVYAPLPYVKKMMYLDVDFYRYFIGRDDQSVHEEVMIRRIDQQIKVNKLLFENVDLQTVENERLRDYMLKYLEIVTTVSSVLMLRSGTEENLEKKSQLWDYIKTEHPWEYEKLRKTPIGMVITKEGKASKLAAVTVYKLAQKIVGFN